MDNKEILKSYAGYKISVFFLLSWKFLIVIGNQSNTANEMQLKKLIQNYKDCQSWKWHLLALNRYKVPLQIYHLNKIICSSMSSFNLFGGTGRWSVRSHRIVSLYEKFIHTIKQKHSSSLFCSPFDDRRKVAIKV